MLDDIAIFIQVVESKSFTAAANKLGISKPVVSKNVSRLEDKLSTRLLNRTTRRLSLTEAGRIFYDRCKKGLDEIHDAQAQITSLMETPKGHLRVNAPMSFGILHLSRLLPSFQQRYPDISIDMNLDDRSRDEVEEAFDVSVRITNLPDSSMIARRIAPCRHVVVASPRYLERYGKPAKPEDLVKHNIVVYTYQSSATQWHFESADNQPVSTSVSGATQINNSLAIREVILQDMGIARMPTFIAGKDIQEGRLVPLLKNYHMLEVSIYLTYQHREYVSPKVRAFIDFMAAHFDGVPDWDMF